VDKNAQKSDKLLKINQATTIFISAFSVWTFSRWISGTTVVPVKWQFGTGFEDMFHEHVLEFNIKHP
jgi:hypothetical protein